jgi:hypothetical protein
MEPYKLSEYYAIATDRVMKRMSEFYESLHSDRGEPITEVEAVERLTLESFRSIKHEMDLCVEAVKEYHGE